MKFTRKDAARWIDSQDACFALNISRNTLKYYRETGILPFSKIDGKIYFDQQDIEAVLRNNLIEAK